jgi:hypothetical protein
MREGDLVAAYQAKEGVVGFAVLASDGRVSPESAKFDTFDLAPSPTIRLRSPIPLEVLKDQPQAKQDFEFLRIVQQGSVFRVSQAGRDRLLSLARQFNPSQAAALRPFAPSSSA